MRYFLKLSYDGTPFHGWQRQPNASSVQQTVEEALSRIMQKETAITGAGRTDAGVHALEMFAHFDAEEIPDEERFLTSLNGMVGHSVAVNALYRMSNDAHARFDALSRTYRYAITLIKDPFAYRYAHRMNKLPDIEKMNNAAALLLDTEDFTSFAKLHSDSKTNVCKVTHAKWAYCPARQRLEFEITADRFLRNMVRALVGTLLEVGSGKLTLEGFKSVIEERDRCSAGVSMPAKGLFLTKIVYPKEIFLL